MNKYIIIFTNITLISISTWAMQSDKRSAHEIINAHLVKHSELYEFDAHAGKFWGEMGPENRWQALAGRKAEIIQKEVLIPIDEQLRSIEDINFMSFNALIKTAKIINNPIGEALTYLTNAEYEKMILALKNSKNEIIKALKEDPLSSEEYRVIKDPKLTPEKLKELSSALFSLRNSTGKEALSAKARIGFSVNVPTTFKILPPGATPENFGFEGDGKIGKMNEFLHKTFRDSKLKIYSEGTKEALKKAITNICTRSQLETMPGPKGAIEGKQIFLFYGEPGTGKSYAAQEIAKELGLPVHFIPALREEDFGHGKITGNNEWTDARLGKLFEAFYVQDKQGGVCYKNPVIIIDEADRMMGKHNNMLKPLMDLFDDIIRTFHSNYLGADIDISGIIFILTANSDFGLCNRSYVPDEFSNCKDKFAAFRDRMEMIYFDTIPQEQVREFLKDYIENHQLFKLSICYSKDDSEEMKNQLVAFIAENFPNSSIRVIKKIAKKLANIPRREWSKELPPKRPVLHEILDEARRQKLNLELAPLEKRRFQLIDELEIIYDEYSHYIKTTNKSDENTLFQLAILEEELLKIEAQISTLKHKNNKEKKYEK